LLGSKTEVALFLLRRSREVLILQRAPAFGGFWHVVAGSVGAGESCDDAARRELAEETGLAMSTLSPVARTRFTYVLPSDADSAPSAMNVTVECALLEVPDDYEPMLNGEHDAHRWCTVGEARRLVHWPNIGDALESLLSMRGVADEPAGGVRPA
jgi:8-oxo-dGTP pyrophosphatase MutT (NUDIX family)